MRPILCTSGDHDRRSIDEGDNKRVALHAAATRVFAA
jgi:hypothetical protein